MMMSNEPIIVLFHENHGKASWFWRKFALFVAHEIIEADDHHGRGIDHHQLPGLEIPPCSQC